MPVDVLDGEVEAARAGALVARGNLAEEGEDVAAQRLELVRRQGEAQLPAEVLEVGPRVAEPRGLAQADHVLTLLVELVLYLPDDLLDDVLEADDARHAAVLVHRDGDVHVAPAELAEERVDALGLRDEVGLAQEVGEREVPPLHEGGEEVLGVEDADDLVDRVLVDRDAGVPARDDGPEELVPLRGEGQEDRVDARHHDLPDRGLRELLDALDHLPALLGGRLLAGRLVGRALRRGAGPGLASLPLLAPPQERGQKAAHVRLPSAPESSLRSSSWRTSMGREGSLSS